MQAMKNVKVPLNRVSNLKRAVAASGPKIRNLAAAEPYYPSAEEEKGLPPWMTTPKFVFVAVLGSIVMLNHIAIGTSSWFTTAAPVDFNPSCVLISSPAGNNPAQWWSETQLKTKGRDGNRSTAAQVVEQCTEGDCPAPHQRALVERLGGYLADRQRMLNEAHGEFGRGAIRNAHEFWRTNQDYHIISGVRDLVRENKFDLAKLPPDKASHLRLLLKNGIEDVPVCFKPQTK
jgi:hypothetical protein